MDAGLSLFCEAHLPGYAKLVMGSGAVHVVEVCLRCGELLSPPGQYIAKPKVIAAGCDPEKLPVYADYRGERPKCEHCGAVGTEDHHWAPKEIFREEADNWPRGWLCKPCHEEWHQRVAGMPQRMSDLLRKLSRDPAVPPAVRREIRAGIEGRAPDSQAAD